MPSSLWNLPSIKQLQDSETLHTTMELAGSSHEGNWALRLSLGFSWSVRDLLNGNYGFNVSKNLFQAFSVYAAKCMT